MRNNKIFYYGIIPALFFQFIGSYFYYYQNPEYAIPLYTLTKILLIIWPLAWILSHKNIFKKTAEQDTKNSVFLGIATGLLFAVIIVGTFYLFSDFFLSFAFNIQEKALQFGLTNPGKYIIFGLFLSIIHSGIEEVYWRLFIITGLKIRFKTALAALISSVFFASHHYLILGEFFPLNITLLLGSFIIIAGLIWALLFIKTKSLISCWISHLFADLSIMSLGYYIIFWSF